MMIALRLFIWLCLVTGIIYPLTITLIAGLFWHDLAQGKRVTIQDKVVGFHLIGQKFESERYFWSRPSANNYDALNSGGTNYSLTNAILQKAIDDRRLKLGGSDIPSDLLYASGSGLDPEISIEAANYQIKRIAKARNLDEKAIENLIAEQTLNRQLGFLGTPRINVLQMNAALDEIKP